MKNTFDQELADELSLTPEDCLEVQQSKPINLSRFIQCKNWLSKLTIQGPTDDELLFMMNHWIKDENWRYEVYRRYLQRKENYEPEAPQLTKMEVIRLVLRAVFIEHKKKILVPYDESINEELTQAIENVRQLLRHEFDADDKHSKSSYNLVYSHNVKKIKVAPEKGLIIGPKGQVILPHGVSELVGKSGSYKTFLAMTIAECLGHGIPFLGTYQTTKTRTLFVNEENKWEIFQPRVEIVKRGLGIDVNETNSNVAYTSYEDFGFDFRNRPKSTDKLVLAIIDSMAGLIIIDVIKRTVRFEENNADQVELWYGETVKQICKKLNIDVLFLHHPKKEPPMNRNTVDLKDMLRGSSEFINIPDCCLYVRMNKFGANVNLDLHQVKCRAAREFETKKIKVISDTDLNSICFWEGLQADEEAEITFESNEVAKLIANYVVKNDISSFTRKDIVTLINKSMPGLKSKSSRYYAAIESLTNTGFITQSKETKSFLVNQSSEAYLNYKNDIIPVKKVKEDKKQTKLGDTQ